MKLTDEEREQLAALERQLEQDSGGHRTGLLLMLMSARGAALLLAAGVALYGVALVTHPLVAAAGHLCAVVGVVGLWNNKGSFVTKKAAQLRERLTEQHPDAPGGKC